MGDASCVKKILLLNTSLVALHATSLRTILDCEQFRKIAEEALDEESTPSSG